MFCHINYYDYTAVNCLHKTRYQFIRSWSCTYRWYNMGLHQLPELYHPVHHMSNIYISYRILVNSLSTNVFLTIINLKINALMLWSSTTISGNYLINPDTEFIVEFDVLTSNIFITCFTRTKNTFTILYFNDIVLIINTIHGTHNTCIMKYTYKPYCHSCIWLYITCWQHGQCHWPWC